MPSLRELHHAVLSDPDADAPRLAYAVGCAATGEQDRAEFIRLQLEAAARMRAGHDGWWDSIHRERELLAAHPAWADPIANLTSSHQFYRGFIEEITLDADEFLAKAEALYRIAPIRRLRLKRVPRMASLSSSPHLGRIVSLAIERQGLGDHDIQELATSPHLSKLAWLSLIGNKITIAGVEALASSDMLPNLKNVELFGNPAHASVGEIVGEDQGQVVSIGSGPAASALEQRYGRKTWLHPVADHGGRKVFEAEF